MVEPVRRAADSRREALAIDIVILRGLNRTILGTILDAP
jgi:hypothetical protein